MHLSLPLLVTLLPVFLSPTTYAKEVDGRKLHNAAQLATTEKVLTAASKSDGYYQGRLFIMKAVKGRSVGGMSSMGGELFRRAAGECADPVQYLCANGLDGCCDPGTICGTYDGVPGCCPEGEKCSVLSGCSRNQVSCGESCCPGGSECTTIDKIPTCAIRDGVTTSPTKPTSTSASQGLPTNGVSDEGCPAGGYKQCPNFPGCCPAGVECVDGGSCNVDCKADDPICGSGCCPDGFVCSKNGEACEVDQSNSFSSIILPTSSATTTKSKTTTTSDKEDTVTAASTSENGEQPTETKTQGSAGNRLEIAGGNWVRSLGGLMGVAVGGVMFL